MRRRRRRKREDYGGIKTSEICARKKWKVAGRGNERKKEGRGE